MDDKILIGIISASSALIGGLIPTLFAYFNTKNQNEFELKKDLLANQKNVYNEVLIALQNIINNSGVEETKAFQKTTNKLAIYGDNVSAKAMNDYYNELINNIQKLREPVTRAEHRKYQKRIINGIRKNLGLEELNSFEIVGFRP
mgnify:CR=1 FL=1|tara:strand:- start:1419 stop:1853 length:435 start_codon:yes stop_codon:yes gene_type:complete